MQSFLYSMTLDFWCTGHYFSTVFILVRCTFKSLWKYNFCEKCEGTGMWAMISAFHRYIKYVNWIKIEVAMKENVRFLELMYGTSQNWCTGQQRNKQFSCWNTILNHMLEYIICNFNGFRSARKYFGFCLAIKSKFS